MSAGDARADETAPLDPGQKATDTMTTFTAETLAAIAPSLDAAARELAHSNMPDGSHSAENFAVAYVRAIAETCGALAANQCADGEDWAPAEWLDGDSDAVTEAAELMGIDLDGHDWTALRRIYEAPSAAAFAACGLAVRAPTPTHAGASITVHVGRDTIDPQGLGSDEECATCEEHILDAVREAFPGATVRAVGNGGRTSATMRDSTDFTDEVKAVVTRAFDDYSW